MSSVYAFVPDSQTNWYFHRRESQDCLLQCAISKSLFLLETGHESMFHTEEVCGDLYVATHLIVDVVRMNIS